MKETYLNYLNQLVEQKINGHEIHGPWTDQLTDHQRAVIHAQILDQTYGGGHPGSQESLHSLEKRIHDKELLTWIIFDHENPVGMANITINNGIAEVVRAGSIVSLQGKSGVSSVQYQRIFDILSRVELTQNIYALEGDIRLAAPIELPSGSYIDTGAKTQHISQKMGINPLLLCVPRYQVHPIGGSPHQEIFLQSRKYLNPNDLFLDEPIYTPTYDHVDISDIAKATYKNSWYKTPEIVNTSMSNGADSQIYTQNTAGIHYSTTYISSDIDIVRIKQELLSGLENSRFVEIILENHPKNINVQKELYKLGCIPLGVIPGIQKDHLGESHPTTIHYGIARREIIQNIPKIELAHEYQYSDIKDLTIKLWNWWKLLV